MPFVSRSQLEKKQQATAPPTMSVVEQHPQHPKQTTPDPPTSHDNTEEQIAELNELLIHVLDELADMKRVLQNASSKKHQPRPSSKHHLPSDEESSDAGESDDGIVSPDWGSEKAPERVSGRASAKKANAPTTRQRGYDFSDCF